MLDRYRIQVSSIGSDRLRLAWDPADFVQCGVRPFTDGYRLLRPYRAYLQIKDAMLDSGRVVAGAGDGEWPDTLRALRDDGTPGRTGTFLIAGIGLVCRVVSDPFMIGARRGTPLLAAIIAGLLHTVAGLLPLVGGLIG